MLNVNLFLARRANIDAYKFIYTHSCIYVYLCPYILYTYKLNSRTLSHEMKIENAFMYKIVLNSSGEEEIDQLY